MVLTLQVPVKFSLKKGTALGLPIYKKISINSHQKRLIHSQLDLLDFGENPFIFEMSNLNINHIDTIQHIEDYLIEHGINTYSYPLFAVAEIPNYQGSIVVVSHLKFLPKFYRHKSKQLNAKENAKYKIVQLKQTHLNHLQKEEFEPVINEYARTHKEIFLRHRENDFLKILKEGMGIDE